MCLRWLFGVKSKVFSVSQHLYVDCTFMFLFLCPVLSCRVWICRMWRWGTLRAPLRAWAERDRVRASTSPLLKNDSKVKTVKLNFIYFSVKDCKHFYLWPSADTDSRVNGVVIFMCFGDFYAYSCWRRTRKFNRWSFISFPVKVKFKKKQPSKWNKYIYLV